ncbi:hypothetical protein PLESTM_001812000 [Pleodorina starrii]|nr:hypothetical protein PLESTM_001812000 [Pleodorina starrii]
MADNYARGDLLGQGTFAAVYKGVDKRTGKVVALKEIFADEKGTDGKKGLDPTALREIKLLRELRHPHIIRLEDAYPKKKSVVLVLEYMHSDLEAVIRDQNLVLAAADVKSYMRQLLAALDTCHRRWVLHRDIKPNNCLIAPDGSLKLADFGLSRVYGSPDGRLTHQVFAQWYRAPELFFGARQYTAAVDVWAAGCIFGELLLRRPLFDGMCDIDVLSKFTETKALPLRQVFPAASGDALDRLSRMLQLDPLRRISSAEALRHPYFSNNPPPTPPALLLAAGEGGRTLPLVAREGQQAGAKGARERAVSGGGVAPAGQGAPPQRRGWGRGGARQCGCLDSTVPTDATLS